MTAPVNGDSRAFLARRYSQETFVYNIDIAGTCNLGCASCPVSNIPLGAVARGERPRGFMPFDLFSTIIEKIAREAPVAQPVITLYNWGEPLLHPDIGRIVRLVRARGWYCAVSTNLNQDRFLRISSSPAPATSKCRSPASARTCTGGRTTKGGLRRSRRTCGRCAS